MFTGNAERTARAFKRDMLHEDNKVVVVKASYSENKEDYDLMLYEVDASNEVVYSEYLDAKVSREDIEKEFKKIGINCEYKEIYVEDK